MQDNIVFFFLTRIILTVKREYSFSEPGNDFCTVDTIKSSIV